MTNLPKDVEKRLWKKIEKILDDYYVGRTGDPELREILEVFNKELSLQREGMVEELDKIIKILK